jgi:peptide/nickel transport system substrate-binding protein
MLSWDPHAAWHLMSIIAVKHVYETLVLVGPDLAFEPSLATSWRMAKPTVWELELRQGVRFHDGTLLTVADVIFSLMRTKGASSEVRRFAAGIARVEDVGGGRFRIITERPDPLLPNKLSTLRIMSKAWAETQGAVAVDQPEEPQASYAREHTMGTGPFRLTDGGLTHFVLERYPDWWGRERWPFDPERVEFTTIQNITTQVADLLAGRVDLLPSPPGGDVLERLEATPGIRTVRISTLRVQLLVMNQTTAELASSDVRGRNPFRDRRVRRAVYQAIDIGRLQREGGFVHDVPIGVPLPPLLNGWSEELDRRLPYDPAASRVLLAEAGYPDGFGVRLDARSAGEAFLASLTGMLGGVGIQIEQVQVTDAERNVRIAERKADLYTMTLGTGLYDAFDYLENLYRSGGNDSGYANPEVDALLDTIGSELSTYARDGLIEQVWRIVLDDAVYVPLFRIVETWAMRNRLELPPDPRLHWDFRYARLKEEATR